MYGRNTNHSSQIDYFYYCKECFADVTLPFESTLSFPIPCPKCKAEWSLKFLSSVRRNTSTIFVPGNVVIPGRILDVTVRERTKEVFCPRSLEKQDA